MIQSNSLQYLVKYLVNSFVFVVLFFHLNSVKVKAKAKVKLSQSCVIN